MQPWYHLRDGPPCPDCPGDTLVLQLGAVMLWTCRRCGWQTVRSANPADDEWMDTEVELAREVRRAGDSTSLA